LIDIVRNKLTDLSAAVNTLLFLYIRDIVNVLYFKMV
jgi:hypothetical protein